MKIIIQRVSHAMVSIDNKVHAEIENGLCVFLGIHTDDNISDADYLINKLLALRIFDDASHIPNLSVTDVKGSILIISQFTLYAQTRKGNRPSYIQAAKPEIAIPLYEYFLNTIKVKSHIKILNGLFGADMKITLTNEGPLTIIIDSKEKL